MEVTCQKHGKSQGVINLNNDVFCSKCIQGAVEMIRRGRISEASDHVKTIQNHRSSRGAVTTLVSPPDPEPYLEPEYWENRRLILRVGACLVRAEATLSRQPVEFAVYRAGALNWLTGVLAFPMGDHEEQLQRAYLFCARKTPAFVDRESAEGGLWGKLETDYLRVLDVMDS